MRQADVIAGLSTSFLGRWIRSTWVTAHVPTVQNRAGTDMLTTASADPTRVPATSYGAVER